MASIRVHLCSLSMNVNVTINIQNFSHLEVKSAAPGKAPRMSLGKAFNLQLASERMLSGHMSNRVNVLSTCFIV